MIDSCALITIGSGGYSHDSTPDHHCTNWLHMSAAHSVPFKPHTHTEQHQICTDLFTSMDINSKVILSRTKSATESRELQFVMGCFTCLHVIKTFMSVSRSHDWVPPDDPRGFMEGLLSVSITLRTVQLLMDER